MICEKCGGEYEKKDRLGKPGLLIHCSECAEEVVEPYTGNMIYSHKTAPSLQINKDPKLTAMLNGTIEMEQTEHKSGSVAHEAETFNYKNGES